MLASLLCLMLFSLARPARAEEHSLPKVGIGFDLFDLTLQPSIMMIWSEEDLWGLDTERYMTKSLYLPLNLSPRFRLEPALGFVFLTDDGMVNGALGFFHVYQPEEFFLSYQGVRVGTSVDMSGDGTILPFLMATVGAELVALSRMSFGFEGAMGYRRTFHEHALHSDVRMIMRFYIW